MSRPANLIEKYIRRRKTLSRLTMALIGGVMLARKITLEPDIHVASAGTGNLGETEKVESDTVRAEN